MEVAVCSKANDMLEPIDDGMHPKTILRVALVDVGEVGQENCNSALLFDLMQLVVEPLDLVAWVLELVEQGIPEFIAHVVIKYNYFSWQSVFRKGFPRQISEVHRKVSIVQKSVVLHGIPEEEGLPGRTPLVHGVVLAWAVHRKAVLRVGVVVADCGINSCVIEVVLDHLGYFLQLGDCCFFIQGVHVMRN